MGSFEALETYFTSESVLAILTAFAATAFALGVVFRVSRSRTGLRLAALRGASWLLVAFWCFVAASLVICTLVADPVEYEVATAKAVAVVSISLGLVMASLVAVAVARGYPVRTRGLPSGRWLSPQDPLRVRATRLAAVAGLPSVRVRAVEGSPLAIAEPPDVLVVSAGLPQVLTSEELDAVLLHEIEHLASADGIEKAFLGTMRRILFFDPFVRLVHRAASRELEFRADEIAARRMGEGGALASALQKVALRGGMGPAGAGMHPRLEDRLVRLRPRT